MALLACVDMWNKYAGECHRRLYGVGLGGFGYSGCEASVIGHTRRFFPYRGTSPSLQRTGVTLVTNIIPLQCIPYRHCYKTCACWNCNGLQSHTDGNSRSSMTLFWHLKNWTFTSTNSCSCLELPADPWQCPSRSVADPCWVPGWMAECPLQSPHVQYYTHSYWMFKTGSEGLKI